MRASRRMLGEHEVVKSRCYWPVNPILARTLHEPRIGELSVHVFTCGRKHASVP